MNKIILLFAIFIFSLSSVSFADPAEQTITLKDGSQIKGVLAGIDNGVYTVKTPIIGDIHISAADVASITNGDVPVAAAQAPAAQASAPNMDAQVEANQKQLMSNPQSMATLQEMMQDPEIAQALQDPSLVQAVTSHDYAAVQSNPNVQKLMSNPKMKALLQQLASQQQQNTPSQ